MRYGIFSDVHSNLEALEAVFGAFKKESIDTYLCVGDVVGYAADPNECARLVNEKAAFTVAGNHDWASVNMFSADYFNSAAKEAILWTSKSLNPPQRLFLESLKLVYQNEDLILAHGTLHEPQEFNYMMDGSTAEESFRILKTCILFVGHTHIAGVFMRDKYGRLHYDKGLDLVLKPANRYIVNTGSVGQPRDGNPKAAYCIYDTGKKSIQIKRVAYDMKLARIKIMEAGLPQFLADRILMGR